MMISICERMCLRVCVRATVMLVHMWKLFRLILMRYVPVFVYLSIIIAELPFELAQAYSPASHIYARNCLHYAPSRSLFARYTSISICQGTMQSHKTRLAIRDDMVKQQKNQNQIGLNAELKS